MTGDHGTITQRARCPETSKLCFNEQEAKDELAAIIVRAMTGGRLRVHHRETGVYKCPRCQCWHLTSRPWNGRIVNADPNARER